ncbi:MAG: hypothetical protein CM1200mP16_03380 [Nitrospina sp.]|nr:MAG: hypothetical protein CM1200mP16_03380 [Nitrospina sp.]
MNQKTQRAGDFASLLSFSKALAQDPNIRFIKIHKGDIFEGFRISNNFSSPVPIGLYVKVNCVRLSKVFLIG